MNRRRNLAALFAVSLVATMVLVYLATSSAVRRQAAPTGTNEVEQATPEEGAPAGRRDPRAASQRSAEEAEDLEQRLVLMLRALYGDRISTTSAQVLMAQVRTQVQTLFPQDWATRFPKILEAAFPGYSAPILATLANVDAFDRWLSAKSDELAGLTPEEREKAVLEKKQELFGEQAVAELESEARTSEKREAAMGETIRSLEDSADTTLDQKLDVYVDALHRNFDDGPSAIALENGSVLAQAFFGLDSVSRQLAELDPEARQQKINDIRREFGYDEEQIAALEERDRQREARWQTGLAYTKERRSLEGRYSGDELERQVAALRERYFADESRTIELEEKDGFFRFERPRYYGRN